MKVLVVGTGGREHALAWRIAASPGVDTFLLPGNPGSCLEPNIQGVEIAVNDYDNIVAFSKREAVDLVVVGPDQALADGLVDKLQAAGIYAFGPTQAAARLEYSKAFAKEVMSSQGIPTARFAVFKDATQAKKFLGVCPWKTGWALKADGLALGKGVVVTQDRAEAEATIDEFMVSGAVGIAGKTLLIEERMEGREVSGFYLCDGKIARELAFACDHKQLLDGGKGPNTGGMGAYSPADWFPAAMRLGVHRVVVDPLLRGMQALGAPFKGVLFIGLMITKDGPRVLEFNARFGDPETQAIMPLIEGDFVGALLACAKEELGAFPASSMSLKAMSAVHVVLAAHGYPGAAGVMVRKGDPIEIPADLMPMHSKADPQTKLFFAGVKREGDGLATNGGRVLGLTAMASTRADACALAYKKLKAIQFSGMQFRRDVGAE